MKGHHSMKTCMGNGGHAPYILNLGIRWRRVIRFMFLSDFPWKRDSFIPNGCESRCFQKCLVVMAKVSATAGNQYSAIKLVESNYTDSQEKLHATISWPRLLNITFKLLECKAFQLTLFTRLLLLITEGLRSPLVK